jgi:hypothetical protein
VDVLGCQGTCVIEFYIEHYGVYVCTPGQAIISNSDGTGHSTRVYAVRYVWAPAAVSYLVRYLTLSPLEALTLAVLIR